MKPFLLVLTFISAGLLAACTPTYESFYQLIPATNAKARACTDRCQATYQSCIAADKANKACMPAYAQCHQTCGGKVIEQRTCVAGCRDDHVAPVATPSLGRGEEI